MDPQFEELARVIGQNIESRFSDFETRFGDLEARIESRLGDFEKRIVSAVVAQLDALETRVEGRMQVHFERMEDQVKRAADGYGEVLESIDRRLDRLETKWDTKIGDHDSILDNHNKRITTLESS
jgi:septation ring formation regulator EzrA